MDQLLGSKLLWPGRWITDEIGLSVVVGGTGAFVGEERGAGAVGNIVGALVLD